MRNVEKPDSEREIEATEVELRSVAYFGISATGVLISLISLILYAFLS